MKFDKKQREKDINNKFTGGFSKSYLIGVSETDHTGYHISGTCRRLHASAEIGL